MIRIIKFKLKGGYKLDVEFDNGTKGEIDFEKILQEDHREIVQELLDVELFKKVKINLHTLCWDNDVDFAPDYLYSQLKINEKVA